MKNALLAVFCSLSLLACGGSDGNGNPPPPPPPPPTDYAPNFVGTWTGTEAVAYTYNGQSGGGTVQAQQPIERTGLTCHFCHVPIEWFDGDACDWCDRYRDEDGGAQ